MPSAVILNSEIPANPTAAQVRAGLQQGMTDSGLTFLQEINSATTPTSVFSVPSVDGGSVECYLAVRYASTTAAAPALQLYQTFSGGTLGTSLGSTSLIAFTASGTATALTAINHPYLRGCVAAYGTSFQLLAVQLFDPASKPTWLAGSHVAVWMGIGVLPSLRGSNDVSINRILRGISAVRADGTREGQPVLEFSYNNTAFWGRTSEDLISVAGVGAATLDTFVAGSQEYLIFYSGNTETCAVRVK